MVTHDRDLAAAADRVVNLEAGRIDQPAHVTRSVPRAAATATE